MTEEENNQAESVNGTAEESTNSQVAVQGSQLAEASDEQKEAETEAVSPDAGDAESPVEQSAESSADTGSSATESTGTGLDMSSLAGLGAASVATTGSTEPAEAKAEASEDGKEGKAEAKAKTSSEDASTEEAGEEEEEKEAPILKELSEEQAKLPWYVVHTYSGFEHMVKASLEERMVANNLSDRFGNVLIPQETVVELVRGQKKTSTRKFLPGYIVVQMDLDDETWHFVCETPKVTGFVGDSRNPVPLSKMEVENLVKQMEGGSKKAKPKVSFEEGDAVKVVDGPFADFNGTVDDVKPDKGKLRVLISIFGRNTPVELDFVQVEKA